MSDDGERESKQVSERDWDREGGGGERDAPSDLEDCALDVPGLARCGVCVRQRKRQREKEREKEYLGTDSWLSAFQVL